MKPTIDIGQARAASRLLAGLEAALQDPERRPRVFAVVGAAGSGKSALLADIASALRARGYPASVLPATLAVAEGGGRAALADTWPVIAMLDEADARADVIEDIRTRFLPSLPAGAVAVLALRRLPHAFVADPGWRALLQVVRLEPPLARLDPPTPRHRAALAVAAVAPRITEDLIAATVSRRDAHRLFEWLRLLGIFEVADVGLVPSAMMRARLQEVVPPDTARLRPRLLAFYRRAVRRERAYTRRLFAEALLDLLLDPTGTGSLPDWRSSRDLVVRSLLPSDVEPLLDLVRQAGGHEAVAAADEFARKRPGDVLVCRERDGGRLLLAVVFAPLEAASSPELLDRDPALAAACWSFRNRLDRAVTGARFLRVLAAADGVDLGSAAGRAIAATVLASWVVHPEIQVMLAALPQVHAATVGRGLGATARSLAHFTQDGEKLVIVGMFRGDREAGSPRPASNRLPWGTFRTEVAEALKAPGSEASSALAARIEAVLAEIEETGESDAEVQALRRVRRDPELAHRAIAESLGISPRTLRRRLARACDLVARRLWQEELGVASS